MKVFVLLVGFCLLLTHPVLSQKKDKFPSYFGVQFKPLIPGDFLAKSQIVVRNGNFTGTFTQKYGYSFGGIVRIGFTKLLSFETGINQIKRHYDIDFNHADSSITGTANIGIVSFDIPFNALVYIQLSKKIYTNASLGTSFVYYPSNVGTKVIMANTLIFAAEGRRERRFDAEINANFGFELRTEKSGFFYIGASAKIPFAPIYLVDASYQYASDEAVVAIGKVNGAYLSLDFRFFFPNVKSKGNINEGPIID